MIEMTLSTVTRHPAFLPFWPLTARQRRRRSPDDLAPTTGNRRGRAEPDPNAGGARSPRPVNASNPSAFVVPTSQELTPAPLKSP